MGTYPWVASYTWLDLMERGWQSQEREGTLLSLGRNFQVAALFYDITHSYFEWWHHTWSGGQVVGEVAPNSREVSPIPSLEFSLGEVVQALGEVAHFWEGDSPFSKRLLSYLYFYIRKLSFHEKGAWNCVRKLYLYYFSEILIKGLWRLSWREFLCGISMIIGFHILS